MTLALIVYLGVEDDLSEAVARRLLQHANRGYDVGAVYGGRGFGDLKRNIRGWNSLSKTFPFLLLTDLDQTPCPPMLKNDWYPYPYHPNLIFRVAVREVEAWLLADASGFAAYLGVSKDIVPPKPETLLDPKSTLIQITRRSRLRKIRECIVPLENSTAQIGPDYNACLSEFVRNDWNVSTATKSSASLARAVARLRGFEFQRSTEPSGGGGG